MKKLLLVLVLLSTPALCADLSDLISPKPLAGRMGTGNKIESFGGVQEDTVKKVEAKNEYKNEYKKEVQKAELKPVITQKQAEEVKEESFEEFSQDTYEDQLEENQEIIAQNNASYADLSLKKLAQDVSFELDLDEAKTSADLAILWAAATENSETMKYTIYKLSNPDEDKPNESTLKKILKPIANFSSVAGASVAGDPYLATGALIGGGLVNAFMKDDKEYNYRFSKVSDADMVLLVRKIDDLQKKLLDLYTDYKTKEQLAKMTQENFKKREEAYFNSQDKTREELIIADVYYKNAKVSAQRAQDDFMTSRMILENLVGKEAVEEIEKE